jgi:hypothetical protein
LVIYGVVVLAEHVHLKNETGEKVKLCTEIRRHTKKKKQPNSLR